MTDTKEKEQPTRRQRGHVQPTRTARDEAADAAAVRIALARNPNRPRTLEYIAGMCEEFVELHGDRRFGDDPALVGGTARFGGQTVMVMGHQKGRDTKENIYRSFGSPRAEGYRKAMRLMEQAEKFGMPVISLIDTGGAYPGIESEQRSVANAIAESLLLLARLRVPTVSIVTGEGGSGGALAIGMTDKLVMLENSIYSVASPEASATILWRDAAKAPYAAAAMKVTAPELLELGIIDEMIAEPDGGGHTDPAALILSVKKTLIRLLAELQNSYSAQGERGIERMITDRYAKFRRMGRWEEVAAAPVQA